MAGKGRDLPALLWSEKANADTQVQVNYKMPGALQIPVTVLNLSAMASDIRR